jgi:hypothetical protein
VRVRSGGVGLWRQRPGTRDTGNSAHDGPISEVAALIRCAALVESRRGTRVHAPWRLQRYKRRDEGGDGVPFRSWFTYRWQWGVISSRSAFCRFADRRKGSSPVLRENRERSVASDPRSEVFGAAPIAPTGDLGVRALPNGPLNSHVDMTHR